MQPEMNLHSTHMYFYISLITLEFMKTTVASKLWTRTLAVQFLYPVQYCCIWMLSVSKCRNVKAWSPISGCGTKLQKLEPCRSSLGPEDKLSRELWCFSLFISLLPAGAVSDVTVPYPCQDVLSCHKSKQQTT